MLPNSPFSVNSALTATLLALTCEFSLSADWPNYRGPNHDGIAAGDELSVGGKLETLWEGSVGLGYSSPVIADGRLIIAGHDGKASDTIYALDAMTGEERWSFEYPQPLGDLYFQGGTTGSLTIVGDRVYHLAREGEVFCLDAGSGTVIWQKQLQKDLGYSKPTWGFSGAPFHQDGRLFLNVGECGVCLNADNGDVIWKTDDDEAGYSTPHPLVKNGRRCLIFSNKRFYVCVDAGTGEKIWEHRWMTRYGVNAADPILSGDHIFLSSGYGKGAVLLKWTGEGEPEKIWQSREMKTQMNAGILIDGYVYGIDGNADQNETGLKCIELLTGEPMWREPKVGHGAISAVGNQLLVSHEDGTFEIAPATPSGYDPVLSQEVVAPQVWTVPVYANGIVYCRNAAGTLVASKLASD